MSSLLFHDRQVERAIGPKGRVGSGNKTTQKRFGGHIYSLFSAKRRKGIHVTWFN